MKGEALRQWLPGHLKRNPDLTLREHCEAWSKTRATRTISTGTAMELREWTSRKAVDSLLRQ